MAGNLWGADVEQLRTLAQQFGKVSDTLLQTSSNLTNQINSSPAWTGNDASQFRSHWNSSHRALLQQTARVLKDESRKLLDNANQQEKASDAAPGSGGGPGTLSSGSQGGSLAGVLGGVLGGGIAALRAGMNIQKYIKAPLTLAKHVGQYGWVARKSGTDAIKPFLTKGRHRLGGPVFEGRHLWQSTAGNKAFEALLRESTESNPALRLIGKASDIASLKDLHKYIPPLERVQGFFEEKSKFGVGKSWEWLGKSGLARGLGWTGVAFSAADSVTSFANGDIKGGLAGVGKTALAVGSFMPPPVGTVCQVASVGITIYENWDTISSVGKNVGEGIVNTAKEAGKYVSGAADTLADAGKSVGKFLGFGD